SAMHVDDLMRELPMNGLNLRFRFEIEQAEIEGVLRFFLDLLDVVQALKAIPALQALLHVENLADEFMIRLAGFDFELGRSFLDGTERFHYEHRMVRDNCTPAFTDNGWMRHALGIANVHDVPNKVIGVFL